MKRNHLGIILLILAALLVTACQNKKEVTPENALVSYLDNGDNSFEWSVKDTFNTEELSLFRIIMTSQTWRDIEWKHELTVIVPERVKYQDALLFITGGSVKEGQPNTHKWTDDLITSLGKVARKNQSIASIIWQVPNQPLYGGLTEDELISFTLHSYQNDSDFTWPLLFPMTKSAIRAMDAVQEFAHKELKKKVEKFVVTGASKRGWTTWLTGAHDPRVKAIAPMVIDVLNMPVNVDYHLKAWGDYSIQIRDYVNLGIAQQVNTPEGRDLVQMIDPYSYRKKLDMPKMLFIGTNDEYWPVDAVKHYIDSIPGENYIAYTPNAGHGLGDKTKAISTLSAFWGYTLTSGDYPACDYSISEREDTVLLTVNATPSLLEDAVLWSARSQDRDFRDEEWKGESLNKKNMQQFTVKVPHPGAGYKAFYVDLKYQAPFGDTYTQSTRMFLTNGQELLVKD